MSVAKMKPSVEQRQVIEFLEDQLKMLQNSHDITSPTNISDIEEFANSGSFNGISGYFKNGDDFVKFIDTTQQLFALIMHRVV
jgi:hypothetical protein